MEQCPHDAAIKALERRDGEIVEWMKRLEQKLDKVVDTLAEVKAWEARNENHSDAIDRAFTEIKELKDKEIAELKTKVSNLEAAYNRGQGAAGMLKFIAPLLWATFGGGLSYLLTHLGALIN